MKRFTPLHVGAFRGNDRSRGIHLARHDAFRLGTGSATTTVVRTCSLFSCVSSGTLTSGRHRRRRPTKVKDDQWLTAKKRLIVHVSTAG
jgi:hypothetical protein